MTAALVSRHPAARDSRSPEPQDPVGVTCAERDDNNALTQLWSRYHDVALRWARRLPANLDPEDVVAEAFTRLTEAIRAGKGPQGAVAPYLFVVVRNVALKSLRDKSLTFTDLWEPGHLTEFADPSDAGGDPASGVVGKSNAEILAAAMARLPPRWREALWYTAVDGMPNTQLAQRIGVSASSAAALAYRARRALLAEWIQQHIQVDDAPSECRWVRLHAGAYLADTLRPAGMASMDTHLIECHRCCVALDGVRIEGSRVRLFRTFA